MTKGPEAFRTISEASDEIGVAQHVLRFWETRFSFIRPLKRAGGRRFYRPGDIVVLSTIRRLLHDEGYTIKGVQKLHRDQGLKSLAREASEAIAQATPTAPPAEPPATAQPADRRAGLEATLTELEAAKRRLDALLQGG